MQLSYTRNPAWLWERRALPYSESMRCDFPFAFPSWFPHSLWMFSGWKDAYKCGNRFGTGVHPLWRPPVSELQQGCRIRNLFRHKIYAKKTTHGVAVIYGVLCPFVGQVEPCLHQIHPQHRLDTPNRSPMLSLRIVRSDHFYPCFPRDDLFHLVEKFLPLRRLFPVSVFNIRQCYLIFHTAHLPCFAFLYYTTFQIFLQGLH